MFIPSKRKKGRTNKPGISCPWCWRVCVQSPTLCPWCWRECTLLSRYRFRFLTNEGPPCCKCIPAPTVVHASNLQPLRPQTTKRIASAAEYSERRGVPMQCLGVGSGTHARGRAEQDALNCVHLALVPQAVRAPGSKHRWAGCAPLRKLGHEWSRIWIRGSDSDAGALSLYAEATEQLYRPTEEGYGSDPTRMRLNSILCKRTCRW